MLRIALVSLLTYSLPDAAAKVNDVFHDADKTVLPCKNIAMYETQSKCVPAECGTRHVPGFFDTDVAAGLKRIAEKGLALGKPTGPASIVDLHQGIVSSDDAFISYHQKAAYVKSKGGDKLLIREDEVALLRGHIETLKDFVLQEFGLKQNDGASPSLYLASPMFFSKLRAGEARNPHDEYWHPHIDTEQYGSFVFTTLSYLTTQNDSFEGGDLVIDGMHLNPISGTVVAFTSGAENPHNVERVTEGTRYTLTVAFTCAPPPTGVLVKDAFADLPLSDAKDEEESSNESTESEEKGL